MAIINSRNLRRNRHGSVTPGEGWVGFNRGRLIGRRALGNTAGVCSFSLQKNPHVMYYKVRIF